jgi:hypothetical protein
MREQGGPRKAKTAVMMIFWPPPRVFLSLFLTFLEVMRGEGEGEGERERVSE